MKRAKTGRYPVGSKDYPAYHRNGWHSRYHNRRCLVAATIDAEYQVGDGTKVSEIGIRGRINLYMLFEYDKDVRRIVYTTNPICPTKYIFVENQEKMDDAIG